MVQQILRNTFRTVNGDGRIREFVILVGATPFSPKEIYRVRVPPTICRPPPVESNEQKIGEKTVVPTTPEGRRSAKMNGNCDAGGDNNSGAEKNGAVGGAEMAASKCGCGGATVCDALNAKERRLVFSAVALSKTAVAHFEGCKVPGKMEKVFMFIRTRGTLVECAGAEGLEEDDSFEVPDQNMKRRRKIRQLRIQVNAPCIVQQQQQTPQPQQQRRQQQQRHRKTSETKANDAKGGDEETMTTTTMGENDENVLLLAHEEDNNNKGTASGGGGGAVAGRRSQRQRLRRRHLQQQQEQQQHQRRASSGGDKGTATPQAMVVGGKESEQYNNGNTTKMERNNEHHGYTIDDDEQQLHDHDHAEDDGEHGEAEEEKEEEEEMASSTWYRLCPFFTNLS